MALSRLTRGRSATGCYPSRTSAPSRVTIVFSRWVWRSTAAYDATTISASKSNGVESDAVTRQAVLPCRVSDLRDPSLPLVAALILL